MSKLKHRPITFLVIALIVSVTTVCLGQSNKKPLTNDDIIQMVQEKVDKDLILSLIATSDTNFDISSHGLIQLTKAKVKKQIIEAMHNAQVRKDAQKNRSQGQTGVGVDPLDPGDKPTTPTPSPTPAPTPKPTPVAIQESQFFTFQLDRCGISGTTVACFFTITNNAQDRRLIIENLGSDLIDDSGTQAQSRWAKLAEAESAGYFVAHEIVANTTVKSSSRFEEVTPTAQTIARLKILIVVQPGERSELIFRNVPLDRVGRRPTTNTGSVMIDGLPETQAERRRREQQEAEKRRKAQQALKVIMDDARRRHF